MDFTILTDHFVLVVMIACLVVGYIIKHATFLKKIPNDSRYMFILLFLLLPCCLLFSP